MNICKYLYEEQQSEYNVEPIFANLRIKGCNSASNFEVIGIIIKLLVCVIPKTFKELPLHISHPSAFKRDAFLWPDRRTGGQRMRRTAQDTSPSNSQYILVKFKLIW